MDRRSFIQSSAAALAGTSVPLFPMVAMAADEIVVGSIIDMSGGLDIYGKPMADCMTLAVEEQNAAGGLLGKKIRLANYDPQSNMQLYAQFAQQSALKDKSTVVMGGITSASREVIRPVLTRNKTLYFYNTQYEGGVCDRNTFCTGVTPGQTVAKLIPHAMKKWGKKVYVVAADYNYGQITSQWVKKFVQENGGSVASIDFFPLDVTNFGPTISKIEQAKPDMIVSALVGGAHISFYRQWAAAGLTKKIPLASTTLPAATSRSCCRRPRPTASWCRTTTSRTSTRRRTRRSRSASTSASVPTTRTSPSSRWAPTRASSSGPRA